MNPAEPVLRSLLMRGLEGDGAAYHAFLRQLGAHLRAYLGRRLFGWPDDVEDLVQECLIAMHNQRHTYQPDQPFTAWAHAIARYKMIDLLRKALEIKPDHALAHGKLGAMFAATGRRGWPWRRQRPGGRGPTPSLARAPPSRAPCSAWP